MACELSIGMTLDCKDGLGGIKKIVLVDKTEVSSFSLDANEIVTAINGPASGDLYTYELPNQYHSNPCIIEVAAKHRSSFVLIKN